MPIYKHIYLSTYFSELDMACCQWCRRTCVCFLDDEEKQSIAIDKEIQRILRKQMKRERKEIKVLLLGK